MCVYIYCSVYICTSICVEWRSDVGGSNISVHLTKAGLKIIIRETPPSAYIHTTICVEWGRRDISAYIYNELCSTYTIYI
jgi:hypothetical protein